MPVPVDVEVTFKGRILNDEVVLSKSEIIQNIRHGFCMDDDDPTEITIVSVTINGVEAELVD